MNKKYIYGTSRSCVICKKEFTPRDKHSKQVHCSYTCRGISQTKMAECAICGKTFKRYRPTYKTCSRECGAKYRTSRLTHDPMVKVRNKMAVFCCSIIHRCFRNKTDRTHALLGYAVSELCQHLEQHFEAGMSWENYGNKVDCWSIDHSRPISSFPITASFTEINALTNLRPMWHSKNCAKRDKYEGKKCGS